MTKHKSFKGRVRARMDKTHESYTTARRQLLAKAQGPEDPATPAAAEAGAEGPAEARVELVAEAEAPAGPAGPPPPPTPPRRGAGRAAVRGVRR